MIYGKHKISLDSNAKKSFDKKNALCMLLFFNSAKSCKGSHNPAYCSIKTCVCDSEWVVGLSKWILSVPT